MIVFKLLNTLKGAYHEFESIMSLAIMIMSKFCILFVYVLSYHDLMNTDCKFVNTFVCI